ncbi:MAG: hypothetical protein C6P37_12480 [Caldibacillus debilis]|uniref:Uncharacterized protein n=1 Tax=Caldibacillus debilis TaxID=301148 RepID=A0A3E0K296_9BACI|nr:hypothetical protein [Bacillaceae bacterium]OUM92999.1 MAG: hypothetical protein BAA03_06190 [Caldibacillus debilis]REJ16510.1 MAG: hypothetical protein C6W57_08395 [Caldibacillus debilis]REJ26883.1 MAG: hypothetical protein C6P37_12480 [Caldibacillus debilis]
MPPVFLRKFLGLHPRGKILNRPRPERAPPEVPSSASRERDAKNFPQGIFRRKTKGGARGILCHWTAPLPDRHG